MKTQIGAPRRALCALVVPLVLLAVPAVAQAASVEVAGQVLRFRAAANESNVVTVSRSGSQFTVVDTGVTTLAAGLGCTATGNQASCSASGVLRVSVLTANHNDIVTLTAATEGTIEGGTGNDTLTGGPLADGIVGGEGSDVLNGGGGSDTMRGEAGADEYNGGAGIDWASYLGSTQAETVNLNNLANDGSADDGPVNARDNVKIDVENVRGGNENDTIVGSNAANTLDGEGGADTLIGAYGKDKLYGGEGADSLRGEQDADLLSGGAGADWASYSNSSAVETVTIDGAANDGSADDGPAGARDNVDSSTEHLRGGAGGDFLTGDGRANVLDGLGGDDALVGGAGADTLNGGANDDTLRGQTGADVYNGGPDTDTASYADSTVFENLTLPEPSAHTVAADDGSPDDGPPDARDTLHSDIENLRGGDAGDGLFGNSGSNRLEGLAGGDVIWGYGGSDVELGGDHDDWFVQAPLDGADALSGQDGFDGARYLLRSTSVSVSLNGVADDGEDDAVPGGAAQEGDNVDGDVEQVYGGSGDDHLRGDGDANVLLGSAGDDRLWGEGGGDHLHGDVGLDRLIGAGGDDQLTGGDDADELFGGDDGDAMAGEDGNDFMVGGHGNDVENGGAGPDFFDQGGATNGGDDLECGTGEDGLGDHVSYAGRSVAVFVEQLEDVFFDGENADGVDGGEEGDNVRNSCERITGGAGDDDFYGGDLGETLTGGPGDDELIGGGGSDALKGGFGDDFLWGEGDGLADALDGGEGSETSGDSGVWDAGLDSVTNLEDTNPG